jgi:SAM-dependent methyltransferase
MIDQQTIERLSGSIPSRYIKEYAALRPTLKPSYLSQSGGAGIYACDVSTPKSMQQIKQQALYLASVRDIDPLARFEFISFFVSVRDLFENRQDKINGQIRAQLAAAVNGYRKIQSEAFKEAFKHLYSDIHHVPIPSLCLAEFARFPPGKRIALQNRVIVKTIHDMNRIYKSMISRMCSLRNKSVLNIGDGVEFESSFLRHLLGNGKISPDIETVIINIDVRTTIKILKSMCMKFITEQHSRLFFLQTDATSMPFPENAVDIITASFMIDDCTRQDILFSEMARVLKPGGSLLLSGHHPDFDNPLETFVFTFGQEHKNQSSLDSVTELGRQYNFRPVKFSRNRHAYMTRFILEK